MTTQAYCYGITGHGSTDPQLFIGFGSLVDEVCVLLHGRSKAFTATGSRLDGYSIRTLLVNSDDGEASGIEVVDGSGLLISGAGSDEVSLVALGAASTLPVLNSVPVVKIVTSAPPPGWHESAVSVVAAFAAGAALGDPEAPPLPPPRAPHGTPPPNPGGPHPWWCAFTNSKLLGC